MESVEAARSRLSVSSKNRRRVLLIDWGSVSYWSLYSMCHMTVIDASGNRLSPEAIYEQQNASGYELFISDVVQKVCRFIMVFNPDEVILAGEHKSQWRKEVYSGYKAQRAAQRATQKYPIDWEVFYAAREAAVSDYMTKLGIKVVDVDGVEGDDVIAVMTKKFSDCEVIIPTTDGDMLQLLKHNGVKVLNPREYKFVSVDDPVKYLESKILIGDSSDNIRSVRGSFSDKKAKWPTAIIGKAAEAGISVLDVLAEMKDATYVDYDGSEITVPQREAYIRNRTLIDMEYIPASVSEAILESYKSAVASYNSMTLLESAGRSYNKMLELGLDLYGMGSTRSASTGKEPAPAIDGWDLSEFE